MLIRLESIYQSGESEDFRVRDDSDGLVDRRTPAVVCRGKEWRHMLGVALESLPPRDRKVLALKYGFGSLRPHTYAEIAKKLRVGKARIGQIAKRAEQSIFKVVKDIDKHYEIDYEI